MGLVKILIGSTVDCNVRSRRIKRNCNLRSTRFTAPGRFSRLTHRLTGQAACDIRPELPTPTHVAQSTAN